MSALSRPSDRHKLPFAIAVLVLGIEGRQGYQEGEIPTFHAECPKGELGGHYQFRAHHEVAKLFPFRVSCRELVLGTVFALFVGGSDRGKGFEGRLFAFPGLKLE